MKRRDFVRTAAGLLIALCAVSVAAPITIIGAPTRLYVSTGGGDPEPGGELVHGEAYTIEGSYGTRSVVVNIFDDATAEAITDVWPSSANFDIDYYTPAEFSNRVPDLPHENVTRYIGCTIRSGDFYTYNCWLSRNIASLSIPANVYVQAYRRQNPDWVFGTGESGTSGDNNYKKLVWSVGNGPFGNNTYWYHDHTGQKDALTDSWGNSFYSSGGLGSLNTSYTGNTGGSGDQSRDEWYGWVKHEYRIGMGPSGQALKFLVNNTAVISLTGANTDDEGTGNRNLSIGAYSRDNPSTNREFAMVDVAMVVGEDAFKRVMLTNNATYESSTIAEFQPITSWDGDIQIVVNKGSLSTGTAHMHIFDASDSPTYIGEVTLQ